MASRSQRPQSGGQSIVEFALILPIMLVLALAVVDLARIYTTMLSVESAAREAADYGTFGSQKWGPGIVPTTEAEMEKRACVAASDLADYVGPDTDCTNPSFSYCIDDDADSNTACVPYSDALECNNPTREPPCRIVVTLDYAFNLLVPLNLELFGVEYGFPDTLTFSRTSTFAMTDLELNP